MKAAVKEHCVGCGLFEELCPGVFCMTAHGTAKAIPGILPAEMEGLAQQAKDSCPVNDIEFDDE